MNEDQLKYVPTYVYIHTPYKNILQNTSHRTSNYKLQYQKYNEKNKHRSILTYTYISTKYYKHETTYTDITTTIQQMSTTLHLHIYINYNIYIYYLHILHIQKNYE